MTRIDAIKNVLSSQEFLDVIKEIKDTHLQTIIYSGDDEAGLREFAYQRIRTINEIMSTLESIAQTGKIKDKAWNIF
tara:strand:+ start:1136 stop:1366 length:231 start_codon:yes stop_codon:yes gene_type:complete